MNSLASVAPRALLFAVFPHRLHRSTAQHSTARHSAAACSIEAVRWEAFLSSAAAAAALRCIAHIERRRAEHCPY